MGHDWIRQPSPVPLERPRFQIFKKYIYLFTWLHRGSELWHVGSSSLTRDRTQVPCIWEREVLATGPPGKTQDFKL